jgi:meiotically up-regulated gene 157 (Mug157) protein
MEDKDLARIFENAFPNTLDTTVRWHVDGTEKKIKKENTVMVTRMMVNGKERKASL